MASKKILYLGNNLSATTGYYGTMDMISNILNISGHNVTCFSNKKNIFFRAIDLFIGILKHGRKSDIILIDVFSTNAFNFAFYLGGIANLFNTPYICILHGGDLPKRFKKSPKRVKYLLGNSQINVAPSDYLYHFFQKYFKVKKIPNAIQIEKYDFHTRDYKSIKLLYVRAIAKIYNPMMAVDVVEILLDRGFKVTLDIIGPDRDGSRKDLESYINFKELSDSITIHGLMSKAEWIKYSLKSNIFINTTNVDNTPVSVIEAMALGLPVVSTSVGGIPYLLEHAEDSMLVAPKNSLAMADAIEKLYSEKKLRDTITTNAREKVESFSIQNIQELWNEVI